MKIEIREGVEKLELSDECLDNPNYVDITYFFGGKEDETTEFTAPIDELYSAVVAFKALRDERKEM